MHCIAHCLFWLSAKEHLLSRNMHTLLHVYMEILFLKMLKCIYDCIYSRVLCMYVCMYVCIRIYMHVEHERSLLAFIAKLYLICMYVWVFLSYRRTRGASVSESLC